MLLEHQENDIESELLKGVLPLLLYQLLNLKNINSAGHFQFHITTQHGSLYVKKKTR